MFTIEQTYNLAALTALCRAMRKTIRHIWRFVRIFCWCIVAVGLLLWVVSMLMGIPEHILLAASAVLLLVLLTEDRLNALLSWRLLIPGTAHSVTTFSEDVYTVKTDSLETRYQYDNISMLCETDRYFFLFLGVVRQIGRAKRCQIKNIYVRDNELDTRCVKLFLQLAAMLYCGVFWTIEASSVGLSLWFSQERCTLFIPLAEILM